VVAAIAVFGGRWYAYVAYASDPFDEVGISLNMKMPDAIRAKGCEMLKARFEGKTLAAGRLRGERRLVNRKPASRWTQVLTPWAGKCHWSMTQSYVGNFRN
jgi:hypothetical protein